MTFSTTVRNLGLLGFTAASLAACGAAQPPRELLDARAAYHRAATGPAAQLRPEAVAEARDTLNNAEKAFASHAEDTDVDTMAYVAERRAQVAQVLAADTQNSQDLAQTDQEIARVSAVIAEQQRQLAESAQAVARTNEELREELNRLNQQGLKVSEESRGTVILVPGTVLFSTGKSTLLPGAKDRLSRVADVVKGEPGRKVEVQGYTDSVGSDATNERLSQQRADAVRDYLISQGVPADQITSKGYGKSRPIASNKTAVGRAQNRRVEIVLQPATGTTNQNNRNPAQ